MRAAGVASIAVQYRTVVESNGRTATGLVVPDEIVAALGAGKRPPVRVTVGPHTYRSTVARMGGRYLIPLSAENRSAAGVAAGDEVDVHLELDDAPREVEVPDDLAAALARDAAARQHFESLSFTHRKEWVRWVTEAKRPETRANRVAKTVEAMRAGVREGR
jgi:hypothetical protein